MLILHNTQTHAHTHSPFPLIQAEKIHTVFCFQYCLFLYIPFLLWFQICVSWLLWSVFHYCDLDPTFMPFILVYVCQWVLALWTYYNVESSWGSVRFSRWNLYFQGVINLEKNARWAAIDMFVFCTGHNSWTYNLCDEVGWMLHLLNQTLSFYCLFYCC